MAMNDNILNLEDGQLYLNLSIPLDETYSSYIEALDALYATLDYRAFMRTERRGRPSAIHPSKMMVLLVYAYMNGTFSCREIEKLMKRDCVCMKVLGMDRIPDHSTIDRFIRDNHDAIADIMRQSVTRLRELGELDGRTVFQDGQGNTRSYGFLPAGRTLQRPCQGYLEQQLHMALMRMLRKRT